MPVQRNSTSLGSALPTKISGIVFWGAVLIGLLFAFVVLNYKERALAEQHLQDAKILQLVIVKSIEYSPDPRFSAATRAGLESNLKPFCDTIKCEAIEVKSGNEVFIFGEKKIGLDAITASLPINFINGAVEPITVEITIFSPSVEQALSWYRKIILLTIALSMMLFGMILQYILKRLLTQPFLGMVTSARKYAEGDTTARFNETRSDEFGFLAKFINRALDTSAKNNNELKDALSRATQSESEL